MVGAVFGSFLSIFKQKNVLALIQNISVALASLNTRLPRYKFPFAWKLPIHTLSDCEQKKREICHARDKL